MDLRNGVYVVTRAEKCSIFSMLALLFGTQQVLGDSAQELSDAALRLKQAHVIRFYESCMEETSSDIGCRQALEELHPREVSVLEELFGLSASIEEHALSSSMASCYDPTHDYLDLIECWENVAESLKASGDTTLLTTELVQPDIPDLQEVKNHILQQLTCRKMPEPVFTFLALERLGKIKMSEMIGYDGISCFRIHGGIDVNGLKFTSVCGHSEDGLVRQLFPGWLWRGPGTSPGQFIAFGTSANFEATARWYTNNLSFRQFLNQAIETDGTYIGDPTEVRCSSWMLLD